MPDVYHLLAVAGDRTLTEEEQRAMEDAIPTLAARTEEIETQLELERRVSRPPDPSKWPLQRPEDRTEALLARELERIQSALVLAQEIIQKKPSSPQKS